MSKRFAPITQGSTLEPINWGDPGDYRNRANAAPNYAEMSDNDYPGAGSRSSRPVTSAQTAKPTVPAKTKPKAVAPVAIKPTAAEAAQAAASAAKARHGKVTASDAVKGREKQAEALLMASCKSGSKFASADAIIAELERAPTDAQLAAVDKHCKSVAAQGVWDRAAAKIAAERGRPSPQSASTAKESVWDRAWAKIKGAKA